MMTKRIIFIMASGLILLSSGLVQAFDSVTEQKTDMSTVLGFDPSVKLLPAALNTDPALGSCFTCPNTSADAGGTTAGALTDSMFGEIRLNSAANVGQEGRNPNVQGQTGIPAGSNTASAFTVTVDTPAQDFLDTGTMVVVSPRPSTDLDGNPMGAVHMGGVKFGFSNTFTFDPATGGSTFAQTVDQTTFTGGVANDNVQLVRFEDSGVTTTGSTSTGDAGFTSTIDWKQTIKDGGFALENNTGSFLYNSSDFPTAAAPTGQDQTNGTKSCVGASGGC